MARVVDENAVKKRNVERANRQGPLKKSASMFVYVVTIVLAVAARLYQLYNNFNFDTGKYINKGFYTNYPLFVMAIGLGLIAFVLITGNARDKVIESVVLVNPWRLRYDRLAKKLPDGAGYASIFMAAITFAGIVAELFTIITTNQKEKAELVATGVLTEVQAKDYNLLQGYTAGTFFSHFMIILVTLTFISLGVNIFKEIGITHANCAALSTYAIWQLIHLFRMLIGNSMVALNTNRLYEMVSRMLAVLFFMAVARVFNGMEKRNSRFWMCFLGYASSITAAVSVLPRYLLYLFPDPDGKRAGLELPDITDVGIIFMGITFVAVFWTCYVYKEQPASTEGNRRWNKAPLTGKYEEMKDIEDEMDFIVKQELNDEIVEEPPITTHGGLDDL